MYMYINYCLNYDLWASCDVHSHVKLLQLAAYSSSYELKFLELPVACSTCTILHLHTSINIQSLAALPYRPGL